MSIPLPAAIDSPVSADDLPRYLIGRDGQGCWVAVETHGRAGGLFRTCQAAVHYAVEATAHRPEAVRIAADRVELRI
ncbi:hypothetical protein ASF49_07085 [Methylobacterium sp. Leaf104]|uniref:hypothetical protein n=1 Tax=Methylobacterium TaxID=407 RepID=UPI0006FAB94A|nr:MULTISPECIES: hypothetical protein [Methylobacterium]KQP33642.1 hypothetical protein ASF49_07085 [Methylobacterium sp. Leaf104]MCI9879815.1 hypothetical protein [Methylobacterium goesingense]